MVDNKYENVAAVEVLSPEKKAEILNKLKQAVDIESQVAVFATFADRFGLDPLIGMVLPLLGDVKFSFLSSAYLCFMAKRMGMDFKSVLGILACQSFDSAAGMIVPPGPDAATDYLIQANSMSLLFFQNKLNELIIEAKKAGCTEAEINGILESGRNFKSTIMRVISAAVPRRSRVVRERLES